jgi:hypothetical protein
MDVDFSRPKKEDKFQDLILEVFKRHVYPEDKYEILAILEASG